MSRPPRAPSFSYRGRHRYFLTFCCRNRDKVFVTPERVDTVMSQIRSTARHEEFEILGYCVMPDHVHLLVEGRTDSSDLRRFAKMAEQRSGAAFAMIEQGPLWQEGYFDRILREGDDVRGVLRYLLENPIRAGIVERVEDYPHLGSDTWTIEEIFDGCRDERLDASIRWVRKDPPTSNDLNASKVAKSWRFRNARAYTCTNQRRRDPPA